MRLPLTSELDALCAQVCEPDSAALRLRSRVRCGGDAPTQKGHPKVSFALEAPPGIGPGMKVLQTSALPLGYGENALFIKGFGTFLLPFNALETSLETSFILFLLHFNAFFRIRTWPASNFFATFL